MHGRIALAFVVMLLPLTLLGCRDELARPREPASTANADLASAFRHVDEHGHDLGVELAGAASAGQLAGGRIDAEVTDAETPFEGTFGLWLRPCAHEALQRCST